MSSVENRVVSMSFDNAAFERKVATTMATLDKLQQSLTFASATDGAANVSSALNNLDLSGISSAVDNISGKFSAWGAVGFTVIQDLTRAALDMASRVSSIVINPMVSGGKARATNIEQAKFLFRGLEMDIEASMESARLAVTGTAFGLDAAAKAAAQLGGSGLRAGDEMTTALRGIAGIAAMTNSSYEEMADIFISSAGAGKVMSNELGRISHRGVNAAAALAKEWDMTEAQVRQMATNGEISFEMFYQGMDAAFGEHATKANETYTGSLANMNAALARIGAGFFGTRMEQQRDLFNALSPLIDNVNTSLKPLIKGFTDLTGTGTKSLIKFIEGISLENVDKAIPRILAGFRNLFIVGRQIATILQPFRDIFPASSYSVIDTVSSLFLKLSKALVMSEEKVSAAQATMRSFFGMLRNIGRTVGVLFGYLTEAFREIFPPSGLSIIQAVGKAFQNISKVLVKNRGNLEGFKSIFRGIFAAVAIAIEIVTEFSSLIFDFFSKFASASGGGILDFFAKMGEKIVDLKEAMVDGEGIASLFDKLREGLQGLGDIDFSLDWILDRFTGLPEGVTRVLGDTWNYIKTWFSELGDKLADVLGPGDFDAVLDAVNLGLVGGLALLLRHFLQGGVQFRVTTGFIERIRLGILGLTRQLQVMQMNLRAEALLKIAAAVAVLAASLFILSRIDSVALTKALAAMAVGFGQLIGVMTVLNSMGSGTGMLKLTALAAGMILVATAALVLAVAMKILASMDWEELAKGIVGITALLTTLTLAVKVMSSSSGGMVRVGIGIMFIAVALNMLAVAMKIFATMSWEEIGKGLAGVGAGLLLIAGAMRLMPKGLAFKAVGLLAVGIALNLIAAAMKVMGSMSLDEIGRGLAAMGLGLTIIALAMHVMPKTLIFTAVGLIAVGVALGLIAGAMKIFGTMQWDEIGRGLAAMAGALLVLALATMAMSGSLAGALAITMVALSLGSLYQVIKLFSGLSLVELGMGLLGIAAALAVIGVAGALMAPFVVPLMGLGVALMLIGGAFALFGAGALAVSMGLEALARAGKKGIDVFISLLKEMVAYLPNVAQALGKAVLSFAQVFIDGAIPIVKSLGVLAGHILDTLIELTPKFIELIGNLITSLLEYLQENFPLFVETGVQMLTEFLAGLREVFPDIIDTAVELIQEFLGGIREAFPDLVETGLTILTELLTGIRDNIQNVVTLVGEIVLEFITGLGNAYLDFIAAGAQMIADMLQGVSDAAGDIVDAGADAIVSFLEGVADKVVDVVDAGFKIVIDMLNGLADSIRENRGDLAAAGWNILTAVFGGITDKFVEVGQWFIDLPGVLMGKIGDVLNNIAVIQKGKDILEGIWSGVRNKMIFFGTYIRSIKDTILGWMSGAIEWLVNVGKDIVRGMWNGISSLGGWLYEKVSNFVEDKLMRPWTIIPGVNSPAKELIKIGEFIVLGLGMGIESKGRYIEGVTSTMAQDVVNGFQVDEDKVTASISRSVSAAAKAMQDLDEFNANPVITPVLDLTKVKQDGKYLTGLFSYGQATQISMAANANQMQELNAQNGVTEIKFEQVNNSPKALSTNDIYRQTRSQIALAKEELSIA